LFNFFNPLFFCRATRFTMLLHFFLPGFENHLFHSISNTHSHERAHASMEMDETRCHVVPFNNEMIDGRYLYDAVCEARPLPWSIDEKVNYTGPANECSWSRRHSDNWSWCFFGRLTHWTGFWGLTLKITLIFQKKWSVSKWTVCVSASILKIQQNVFNIQQN
jgi:hypothetical protein